VLLSSPRPTDFTRRTLPPPGRVRPIGVCVNEASPVKKQALRCPHEDTSPSVWLDSPIDDRTDNATDTRHVSFLRKSTTHLGGRESTPCGRRAHHTLSMDPGSKPRPDWIRRPGRHLSSTACYAETKGGRRSTRYDIGSSPGPWQSNWYLCRGRMVTSRRFPRRFGSHPIAFPKTDSAELVARSPVCLVDYGCGSC
jgi:hypothetical protein